MQMLQSLMKFGDLSEIRCCTADAEFYQNLTLLDRVM